MTRRERFRNTALGVAALRYRTAFATVAALSAVLNVLLLGGSIYMMMVYDSVLPSHSLPTLFGLLGMVAAVYAFQGYFEGMRGRILGAVAVNFDKALALRVHRGLVDRALEGRRGPEDGLGSSRDLEQIRAFLAGNGAVALIDLPWIAFFLGILFLLHPWLGLTALAGTAVLLALTWATEQATGDHAARLSAIAAYRSGLAERNVRHSELLTALGMRRRLERQWEEVNDLHLAAHGALARTAGRYGGHAKIFRLFLQSLMLTVGALLVISGKASGGVIFASSILAGRALAPVDQAIANWRGFVAARQGWHRLNAMLGTGTEHVDRVRLPEPTRELRAEGLSVAPPGTARLTLDGVDFTVRSGSALGIVGPSASGKSTLGRALIGVWKPVRGAVRLDGARLDQWDGDELGRHVGYLPQAVELMEGSVAQNVARFEPDARSEDVVSAAQAAGAHELILGLPDGYETEVGADGGNLSAGQRQRVALARALYRDPFLVLLDEPNSNLDGEGEAALSRAVAGVRRRGGIALIIAHRPAALAEADLLLVLKDGRVDAFGAKADILARLTRPTTPVVFEPVRLDTGTIPFPVGRDRRPSQAAGGER